MKSKKMKVLAVLMALGMMACVLAGCGGGDSGGSGDSGQQVKVWKLAHEENEGEMMDIYAKAFKSALEEVSGGAVTLDLYPNGTLGDNQDLFDSVVNGTVDFCITDPGWVQTSIPEVGIFSLHFFFPADIADYDKLCEKAAAGESEGFKMIDELYAGLGVTNLQWFPEGGNAWTCKKALKTPEDFKGVKFRTMASSIISESYNAYGANAVMISYTELYSALQLGTAEGQVNPVFAINSNSYYEVQDYLMLAYPDTFIGCLNANTAFYDSLTDEEKAWIDEANKMAYEEYISQRDGINEQAIADMEATGQIEIIEFTDEMREPFKKIAEENRDIFLSTCDDGQDVMDAFQKDFDAL